MRQIALALMAGLLMAGCGGSSTAGGDTTCTEWLDLDLPTQESMDSVLSGESNLSEDQQAILKDALREADLSTGERNMVFASMNILEYCAPDGTGSRPNADHPISGALR